LGKAATYSITSGSSRQADGKASFWPSTRDQSQIRPRKSKAKPPY